VSPKKKKKMSAEELAKKEEQRIYKTLERKNDPAYIKKQQEQKKRERELEKERKAAAEASAAEKAEKAKKDKENAAIARKNLEIEKQRDHEHRQEEASKNHPTTTTTPIQGGGVDSRSQIIDSGLVGDEDEMARREEKRWGHEFDKKRREFNADNPPEPPTVEKPQLSSGFTVAEMDRMMRESDEKKMKNLADRLAQEKENRERIKRELEDARKFESLPQPKFDPMPSNLDPKKELDFVSLKIGSILAEKPRTPAWVIEEATSGKSKRFPQRLLDQINYARQHPLEFSVRLRDLLPLFLSAPLNAVHFKCDEIHADETYKDGVAGLEELIRYLEGLKPMKALALVPELSTACLDLVEIQGPQGLEGTEGETDEERKARFFRYGKTTGGIASQVVCYGAFMPVHVVLNLLLDDGQKDRPKRRELLNPEWGVMGIHAGRHTKKAFMVVCLFAHGVL